MPRHSAGVHSRSARSGHVITATAGGCEGRWLAYRHVTADVGGLCPNPRASGVTGMEI